MPRLIAVLGMSPFQFLLVRLRDVKTEDISADTIIFQFLLVRLRAPLNPALTHKLRFQFLLVRLRAGNFFGSFVIVVTISIPSGAIKRPIVDAISPEGNIFQFLLVRLRGSRFAYLTVLHDQISIPSGAIKSTAL